MKPILFNTDMVQEILEGRKTVTRRVAKITINNGEPVSHDGCNSVYYPTANKDGVCADFYDMYGFYRGAAKPPYRTGDILYVRETWGTRQAIQCLGITEKCPHKSCESANGPCFGREYIYKAEPTDHLLIGEKWHPSIHMPKEAARLFLRVTDVRVERLQEITEEQAESEGLYKGWTATERSSMATTAKQAFMWVWDSTIKPADRATYGWAANPWVWVIEFERCKKPEVSP